MLFVAVVRFTTCFPTISKICTLRSVLAAVSMFKIPFVTGFGYTFKPEMLLFLILKLVSVTPSQVVATRSKSICKSGVSSVVSWRKKNLVIAVRSVPVCVSVIVGVGCAAPTVGLIQRALGKIAWKRKSF